MLAILTSLAEYFNMINGNIQPKVPPTNIEKKPIYVIYRGKTPRIYASFEQVIAQQIEKEKDAGVSWKKYLDIDQSLSNARNILRINYLSYGKNYLDIFCCGQYLAYDRAWSISKYFFHDTPPSFSFSIC